MDTKSFLDELLKAGRELAEKGQSIAEEKLNLDSSAATRDATLSGMKTGAIAAGALAILLGTKTGRKVTSSAIKLGSLAAIGGVAWKAYQNYQEKNGITNTDTMPINKLDDKEANKRSVTLLTAMIAAAKADGDVSDNEMAEINKQIKNLALEGDTAKIIKEELAKPLDIAAVAALAEGEEAKAAEIYLVSMVVTDKENPKERQYLDDLAKAMKIPEELLTELNTYNDGDKKEA
jgi:uncharacterized membrane protein YebE (DUF533 family)